MDLVQGLHQDYVCCAGFDNLSLIIVPTRVTHKGMSQGDMLHLCIEGKISGRTANVPASSLRYRPEKFGNARTGRGASSSACGNTVLAGTLKWGITFSMEVNVFEPQ